MLAARLLTALSLSSFALLSSASMTPDSDLAERALSVGDDIDAPNWQRDLHERSPEPCATGSCPCTNDDCRRPKPKPKPKKNQEKIYRGIDFERQAGNTYVRVILADSMRIGSPPIVIDTKEVSRCRSCVVLESRLIRLVSVHGLRCCRLSAQRPGSCRCSLQP